LQFLQGFVIKKIRDNISGYLQVSAVRTHFLAGLKEQELDKLYWTEGKTHFGNIGTSAGRIWAPALNDNLALILYLSDHVVDVFASTGPYVQTHRDIEPWNVLMTPIDTGWRPTLVDWDVAGPDSAPLEAAHVLTTFARNGRDEPAPDRIRRAAAQYVQAGGQRLSVNPDLLARTIGMRLARIAARINVSLGATSPSVDPATADVQVSERIANLPTVVAAATAWAARYED